jgi:hypothetical protein
MIVDIRQKIPFGVFTLIHSVHLAYALLYLSTIPYETLFKSYKRMRFAKMAIRYQSPKAVVRQDQHSWSVYMHIM